MRTEPQGRYFRCLVVARIDLDTSEVTLHPQMTPFAGEPEGVFGVVWSNGVPVGDVTVRGEPAEVLPLLPAIAARTLALGTTDLGSTVPDHDRAIPRSPALGGQDVTVAVCTRNRPEDLAHCLEAIRRLRTQVAEVVVVDNAPRDDATQQLVAAHPFVRYVREPRAGLDWARNRALLEARTQVVAYTDDDALVDPGWVEGLLRGFNEIHDAAMVTGLVIPLELATPAQVIFEARGFGRGYRRRIFRMAPGSVADRQHRDVGAAGTGADMAVLRDVALGLGGFDPALDVGTPTAGGGDLEFFFRIVAAGYPLVYEPSAVVLHRHRTTMEALTRQRRGDGTGPYSWWFGAGPRYGRRHAAAMRGWALQWAVTHHGRNLVRTLVYPDLWPSDLIWAEARGAARGATRSLYRRAVAQAAEQAAAHPNEPTAPPLVFPRA